MCTQCRWRRFPDANQIQQQLPATGRQHQGSGKIYFTLLLRDQTVLCGSISIDPSISDLGLKHLPARGILSLLTTCLTRCSCTRER